MLYFVLGVGSRQKWGQVGAKINCASGNSVSLSLLEHAVSV